MPHTSATNAAQATQPSVQFATPQQSSPPNIVDGLQRRVSELEVENNVHLQKINMSEERIAKSQQLIQELLIEKVCI